VTFRTADSLPESVMARWLMRRAEWLDRRGVEVVEGKPVDLSNLSFEDRREYDRVFERSLRTELDRGHGECLLKKPEHAKRVAEALRHFDGERDQLGDFVVMPNHVHLLVVPLEGHELSGILRSWKGFTARAIHKAEGRQGGLWQGESWDRLVRSRRQLERFRDYIADNPRLAKLREGEFVVGETTWRFEER